VDSPELRPSARRGDQTHEGRSEMWAWATKCEGNSSRGSRVRKWAWGDAQSLLPGSDMYFDSLWAERDLTGKFSLELIDGRCKEATLEQCRKLLAGWVDHGWYYCMRGLDEDGEHNTLMPSV
jgi:hypothetical protein